ncbi:MAG: hypothetical protein ACLT9P_04975 [Evtepia gabavorous]
MASAFHALYDTVQETLHPESANTENPAEIFTSTADKVYAKCVLRTTCWQKEYQDTRRAFNDATGPILERGRALATDFSGQFSARCVHFPELLGEVNRQLTAFLRRRQALRRDLADPVRPVQSVCPAGQVHAQRGHGALHRADPRPAPAGKIGRVSAEHESLRRGGIL